MPAFGLLLPTAAAQIQSTRRSCGGPTFDGLRLRQGPRCTPSVQYVRSSVRSRHGSESVACARPRRVRRVQNRHGR
ncbi:hypothetical protein L227DRAFT_570493 [Lentinus tigrinus ALCF2SS1-6]|uniref:Uncharacterized protein n=1 Tax=Lentinus tigrinus ALCF2SS1-6 TaxID=1328759 RepID=A0A5C2SSG9_9APHY|nr:hypothetical protein L227DRAFT_570493 [Lentinus tigrinus ALCF2SS1-6]